MTLRRRNWVLVGILIVLGGGGLLTMGRREVGDVPQQAEAGVTIRGFQTVVNDGSRVRLKVSAEFIRVTRPRLFGPLRIGFQRSLVASGVRVEIFDDQAGAPSRDTTTAKRIEAAIAGLAPKDLRHGIAYAEVGPVEVLERQREESTVLLTAARCRTAKLGSNIVCEDGKLRREGRDVSFRKALFDGRSWRLTPTHLEGEASSAMQSVGQ